MGVREKLNEVKPAHVAIGTGVCLLVAALIVIRSLAGGESMPDKVECLKCVKRDCGEVVHMQLAEAMAKRTVEGTDRTSPAVRCPKCGENSLAWAVECPNCKIAYHRRYHRGWDVHREPERPGPPMAKCPKCGWDPAEAQREAIRKDLEERR